MAKKRKSLRHPCTVQLLLKVSKREIMETNIRPLVYVLWRFLLDQASQAYLRAVKGSKIKISSWESITSFGLRAAGKSGEAQLGAVGSKRVVFN